MEPFGLARHLEARYADDVRATFPFADEDLRRQVDEKIADERLLASGPIVALQCDFKPGGPIAALRNSGYMHASVA